MSVEPKLWVAILNVSDPTAAKISGRHGLAIDDVRDAIQCVEGLLFTWDWHETRGLRAIIEATICGRRTWVIIYPTVRDDEYNLGTAYPD